MPWFPYAVTLYGGFPHHGGNEIKRSNQSAHGLSHGVNATFARHHHPIPVFEELHTILNGSTCLAKLDLAEENFQVEVIPE